MRIKVSAPFAIPGQARDGSLEIPAGARVGDIFRKAHVPLYFRLLPVLVNGVQVKRSRQLEEGDKVVFVFPLSGG